MKVALPALSFIRFINCAAQLAVRLFSFPVSLSGTPVLVDWVDTAVLNSPLSACSWAGAAVIAGDSLQKLINLVDAELADSSLLADFVATDLRVGLK